MTVHMAPAGLPSALKLLAHDLRWQLLAALARSDRRAQELVALLGKPANLVSYHLQRLAQARLVRQQPSAADGRAIYYSLDLAQMQRLLAQTGAALHPALGAVASAAGPAGAEAPAVKDPPPARVLFLCTHNSARSQMAEAILRHLGGDRVGVFSAGSEPSQIHPMAVETMQARGIRLTGQHSKHLREFLHQRFDYVITVCDLARETCPVFPGHPEQIHWSFPDPAAIEDPQARRRAFQYTADELTTRIHYLLLLISVERGQQRRPGRQRRPFGPLSD